MKFYNRESELALLRQAEESSRQTAHMTFVVGRRRIGKTSLLVEAYRLSDFLYFFIAKKSEGLLCAEFAEEITEKLGVPVFGELRTFKEVFGYLMELSKTRHFTLVIDEFQEFRSVNASVFSEMQKIWDAAKDQSKMNLVLCGSVYSMMSRIFEHSKEPLFGRATGRLHVRGFDVATLKKILCDHYPAYGPEDLLALFLTTGGVPRYVELLIQQKAFTRKQMLAALTDENSLFLDEGRNVLIEEFGKDHANYFSILSLIASGKTSRAEIESILEMQAGGFLDRLENEFNLIRKVRPILDKPSGRSVKYLIQDNFLNFWFRFIYKHRSAVEAGNLGYLKKMVDRDYETYSGKVLEKYFVEKLKAEKKYNQIGTWWSRRNDHEIDIVGVDDVNKAVLIGSVKRNKAKLDLEELKRHAEPLLEKFTGYKVILKGFSLEDVG